MTQQQIAEAVVKERATGSLNYQRLLGIPADLSDRRCRRFRLTMGYTRALAGLGDAGDLLAVARSIGEGDLSVRDAEALDQSHRDAGTGNPRRSHASFDVSRSVPRRSVPVSCS